MTKLKEYKCIICDEVIFDGDELNSAEEGFNYCECKECFYEETCQYCHKDVKDDPVRINNLLAHRHCAHKAGDIQGEV
jgi:hypothetical protein